MPGLRPWDQHKVTAANRLYAGLAAFAWELIQLEIPFTIENPTSSWLWDLPCMAALIEACEFVDFHNCAYGGGRKKATSFLTNHAAFQLLARECPGDHQHEAWDQDAQGGFNTAKEAEYPLPLCNEYASIVVGLLQARGLEAQLDHEPRSGVRPHSQGKRSLGPQLIPEYKHVRALKLPSLPALDGKSCIPHELYGIPAGSKLLRAEVKGGENRHHLCIFGVYHTDREFLDIARSLWHPYDELVHLPDRLIRAIHLTLSLGKLQLAKHRLATVTRWQGWASELKRDEAALKSRMEPQVAEVLKSKRLLLLAKIANEIGWPDEGLHKEIRQGFRLVGKAPYSGVFKRELKKAPHTEADLRRRSKFLRPAILGRVRAQQPRDTDSALYEITLKEAVEKGWMDGPFNPEQVTQRYGDDWMPVRRFGLQQRSKIRPIEDFRESELNLSFEYREKVSLQALDHVLWAATIILKHCRQRGEVRLRLSTGEELLGPVHPDWTEGEVDMLATTFDLKSAYKQFAIAPRDASLAVITVKGPTSSGLACFPCKVLPFGATASVLHFCRVSTLIWAIGCHLGILWGTYIDDFPTLMLKSDAGSTTNGAKALFRLVGTERAEDKLRPPAKVAEALGIEVNLSGCGRGEIEVRNKPSRVAELITALDELLDRGAVVPATLPSTLGRLQFAEMQIMGRAGRLAMADVRDMGHTSKEETVLEPSAVEAFELLRYRLGNSRP